MLKVAVLKLNHWSHHDKKGSTVVFISWATVPESGYSSKFDTSPKLFTTGT
jgi:hypothetical protein